jgi:hypothetical protein
VPTTLRPRTWWLSFATDDRFLGVAVVGPSETVEAAADLARELGIHPGGEVAGLPTPGTIDACIGPQWRNRLLTRPEARKLDSEIEARMFAEGYEPSGAKQAVHVIADPSEAGLGTPRRDPGVGGC